MRPASILAFQRLLFAAVAIDLVNNLLSSDRIAARLVAAGHDASPLLVLAICLASPLVGLLFWYLVARRRSRTARLILSILVAAGAAGFAVKALQPAPLADRLFVMGLLGELLKLIAVSRLFTADARRWFETTAAR